MFSVDFLPQPKEGWEVFDCFTLPYASTIGGIQNLENGRVAVLPAMGTCFPVNNRKEKERYKRVGKKRRKKKEKKKERKEKRKKNEKKERSIERERDVVLKLPSFHGPQA